MMLQFVSCSYDGRTEFAIPWVVDPDKVADPVVGVQIKDGDVWTEGTVNGHNITFVLRYADKAAWNDLDVKFDFDTSCVKAVAPASVDLSSAYTMAVSDNYVDVKYTLSAEEFQPLKNVKVTIGEEENQGVPDADKAIGMSFIHIGDKAKVAIRLKADIELLSPSDTVSVQNLSSPLQIKVKDKLTSKESVFTLNVISLNIPDQWKDVTEAEKTAGASLPSYMKILKKTNIAGIEGNTAFIAVIPAGHVSMKTASAELAYKTWFLNNQKVGDVVTNNSSYSLFIGGPSVEFWKPSTRTGYINDGAVGKEAILHWNIMYYSCPPTLGVKDGKASISYGEIIDGNLYKFDNPNNGTDKSKFTGGSLWNVDAAVTGYALPLKDSVVVISKESASDYKNLADKERNFVFSTVSGMIMTDRKIYINGSSYFPTAQVLDAQNAPRTFIGVRSTGDVIAFVSERYCYENNYMVDKVNYPSVGTTIEQAAEEMQALGCTDAIAFHTIEYAVGVLQNGETGLDLTKTLYRVAGKDLTCGNLIMFK